ncbi:hypothetical protein SZN_26706 [Streptomyces zinciresistens K42]|uniref:Uncharacterized protein n=1 Tax=Streptomyces zinciresistens K42 TaxID=700597 RepID=G2GIK1_9ACTN|nr:hypothetical protein SZN_26706 [Streptomyces zinciresistens K42]
MFPPDRRPRDTRPSTLTEPAVPEYVLDGREEH